jgi:aerobic-type carbon monoxide dehydrogenase small subunit (CoxS/CutS family)
MENREIFEPYERLIDITIEGRAFQVPENNSLLRCLQFLDLEGVSDAELCWNGDCLDCTVTVRNGESEKSVIACRSIVQAGTEILTVNEKISFTSPD